MLRPQFQSFFGQRTRLNAALGLALLFAALPGHAQQTATQIEFLRPQGAAGATLSLVGPDGQHYEQFYGANQNVLLSTRLSNGQVLNDGSYRWELLFAPSLSTQQQQWLAQRANSGTEQLPPGWPGSFERLSGSVLVAGGQFIDTPEESPVTDPFTPAPNPEPPIGAAPDDPQTRDQVIADDLIVQFSLCVGTDCVNGENFGFDTIRIKENNTRIAFQDTSTGAFPANDWELTANDSASGGLNRFSIRDTTAGRDLMTLLAGAPNNSIYLTANGNLGLGTSQPTLDLQVVNGNTPAIRLEQDNTSGFTPQTWDLAGNEAGFFIRDVSSGSTLPFRVLPGGAPTNSLVVDSQGDIASGLPTGDAALHIRRAAAYTQPWLLLNLQNDGDPNTEERLLEVDATGNLFVGGSITQLSSRTAKENFSRVIGSQVLDKLSQLPLWTWNYLNRSSDDRHIGPVAEDFYATFGFGQSERSLAPADMAGVALAATQALQAEIADRDAKIEALEQRLARLETLLSEPAETAASAAQGAQSAAGN